MRRGPMPSHCEKGAGQGAVRGPAIPMQKRGPRPDQMGPQSHQRDGGPCHDEAVALAIPPRKRPVP